jgi:hypothetical protein
VQQHAEATFGQVCQQLQEFKCAELQCPLQQDDNAVLPPNMVLVCASGSDVMLHSSAIIANVNQQSTMSDRVE